LGHAAAWYAEFYDYRHLLVLGRVTTGTGGDILLDTARRTLRDYPAVAERVTLAMPDEANKRLGQSVAAAALHRT
ncbi:MAG: ROK family protein, partial [Kiritimatiellaeota bacterium]|nr:ROK family protein [Kiritimatiellota bacterium]